MQEISRSILTLTEKEQQCVAFLLAPPYIRKILEITSPSWITGGTVRDCLFFCEKAHQTRHQTGHDHSIDIATALPFSALCQALSSHGIAIKKENLQHKSLQAQIAPECSADITSLRIDKTTDGRHAVTLPTEDIYVDSLRRDFTINALYLTKSGQIFDFHNSKEDLQNRNLRFIGDPHQKLEEDILRLLRFFRFLSPFQDQTIPFDPHILCAILAHREKLSRLSAMRLTVEFKGLLQTPDPQFALSHMQKMGILDKVYFPIASKIPQLSSGHGWKERLITLLEHSSIEPLIALKKFELKRSDRLYIAAHFKDDGRDGRS